jgi:D-alanyl-D-alanine carboxypeptidase/D-alanyl-D-alanine-endopeptidase (penicillin-binding protein 4)
LLPRQCPGIVVLTLATIGLLAPATAGARSAQQALAPTLGAQMRAAGGASGAWVADGADGKSLYSLNAEVRRTPASVQKLLTTSTALDRLGDSEHLETLVRHDGTLDEDGILDGNLYLQGFGDPSFETGDLALLATRIRDAGISEVGGRVYGDESYFDSRRGPWGFQVSRDVGPLSALSLNEGTLRGFGGGFQANPPSFVAQRLDAWLDIRGVDVARAPRAGKSPGTAEVVAQVQSPSIAALVRWTNHISDNYYAEMLLKGLGARFRAAGSTAAGASVVRKFQGELGVNSTVLDGSGLSRGNAISPHAVGQLLIAAEKRPWFDSFYRSLPMAGQKGTLRKRMRHTAAAGRCRAKTGTLRGVSGLAGYCRSRGGRRFVFALLMNGVNVYRARAVQDRIAATLASR